MLSNNSAAHVTRWSILVPARCRVKVALRHTYVVLLRMRFATPSVNLDHGRAWHSITCQMIYHPGASLSEQWITAVFVTVCCSMSMVSNTLCSHFFGR